MPYLAFHGRLGPQDWKPCRKIGSRIPDDFGADMAAYVPSTSILPSSEWERSFCLVQVTCLGFCSVQTTLIIPDAVFCSFLMTAKQRHLVPLHQSPRFSQLQSHPFLFITSTQEDIFRPEMPAWKSHAEPVLPKNMFLAISAVPLFPENTEFFKEAQSLFRAALTAAVVGWGRQNRAIVCHWTLESTL